jgi:hypothetical protein
MRSDFPRIRILDLQDKVKEEIVISPEKHYRCTFLVENEMHLNRLSSALSSVWLDLAAEYLRNSSL